MAKKSPKKTNEAVTDIIKDIRDGQFVEVHMSGDKEVKVVIVKEQ